MTRPRKQQISLEATPYYHCHTRCVRGAFLCGIDKLTGRSYEHRRQQIEDNILRLSSIFFIDVAAFAVMTSHYHLVIHIDREACMAATPREIVRLWHSLFLGKQTTKKYLNNEPLEPHEIEQVNTFVDLWRSRLCDLSWFMKVLNENTARRANKEDECTGHFWQARFSSKALLDAESVLTCMAYCDLNPIRAAMATTPERSDHTSIKMRIDHCRNKSIESTEPVNSNEDNELQPPSLFPFVGSHRQPMPKGIPFNLIDYLELVDWTGRAILENKRGSIPANEPAIIARLNVSPKHWMELSTNFENRFKGLAGTTQSIAKLYKLFGLSRQTNRSNSQLLFG